MDLDNSLEVVVYYILIKGMVGLDHRDEFPLMSALVCMVTHWTWPMVSHDVRLSSGHDFTKLLHCVVSQPWENIEFVLKLVVTLTYEWDRKLIIYSLWIGLVLIKPVAIGILKRGTMISHRIEIRVSPWVILKRRVHENYGHSSSLSGTWHKLLKS